MHKSFKYRIYPTSAQKRRLINAIEECRWLYNHFLEQRKTLWMAERKNITLYEQFNTIPSLRKVHPSLDTVYAQILRDAGTRVDLAVKGFYRRIKTGEHPGYPRFKTDKRYNSITYTQLGFCIDNDGKLACSKIGHIKIVQHRPICGTIKTLTIRRTCTGKWYASFVCDDVPAHPLPMSDVAIGIDVGIHSFLTTSVGEHVENPRFFEREEQAIARVHKKMSKTTKGTTAFEKRRKVTARICERITHKRTDFANQVSRTIINNVGVIAVEDIEINRILHWRCMSKRICDAAWSQFFRMLTYKAEDAGRVVIRVNPAYTSQDCNRCGHRQKMALSDRVYRCPCCGLVIDRDHNAALNILRLGLQSLGKQSLEATIPQG